MNYPAHNLAHMPGPDDPMEIPMEPSDMTYDELMEHVTGMLMDLSVAATWMPADHPKRIEIEQKLSDFFDMGFMEAT